MLAEDESVRPIRKQEKRVRGGDFIPKFEFSISELEMMSQNKWLTDRERKVFDLFYRRGWKIEDIAAELDVNRSTINRELKSVRSKTIARYF